MVVLKRATSGGSPFFMTNFSIVQKYSHPGFLICRMITLSQRIIDFYKTLQPPSMPRGIEILYPQKNKEVMQLVETFFNKFYDDNKSRHLIFGINPGRFGAGTTGINFTAPKQLKQFCGIDHPFRSQTELSAEFIYEFIQAYGGVNKFYEDYFITSVSPLGFMKDGDFFASIFFGVIKCKTGDPFASCFGRNF